MSKVKVEQVVSVDLQEILSQKVLGPSCPTKVTRMGHITEVLNMCTKSDGTVCIKLNRDEYLDTRTGEVCLYKHTENRSQGLESIRQTLERIRGLVNSNIFDCRRVRWATLTYKENMTDTKQLYHDYEDFWKRFKYWNKVNGYSKPEYITVVEPQGRGAWHIHAFFIWSDVAPFIPNNDVLCPLWGHGFTSIKAFSDSNSNPGAYFSAYLADMPLDKFDQMSDEDKAKALSTGCTIQEKLIEEDGEQVSKKFVKGARLHFYPPGMNIVRSSRGVHRPVSEYMTRWEAEKKVSAGTETFSRSYHLLDEESGKSINYLSKTYYNDLR